MKIDSGLKLFLVGFLSLTLSHLPTVAAAETLPGLVSTRQVVSDLNRQQAEQNIQDLLSKDEVKNQLMKYGISADEASQRVASLSDMEIQKLNNQVVEARAGGAILVTILVVVLIIFLVKRI